MLVGVYSKVSHPSLAAFAKGVEAAGHRFAFRRDGVFTPDQREDFDVVAINGLHAGAGVVRRTYRLREVPVVVMDLAYLLREKYHAVWMNWVNWLPDEARGDRAGMFDGMIEPAREGGEKILLCGQAADDHAHMMGRRDIRAWAEATVEEIREHTDREIVWRPHPKTQFRLEGVGYSDPGYLTLEEELEGDWHSMVTYNSTCGLKALLNGIPVFCDPDANYAHLCADGIWQIEEPVPVDRAGLSRLLERVSYTQWTIPELERGDAFNYLLSGPLEDGRWH